MSEFKYPTREELMEIFGGPIPRPERPVMPLRKSYRRRGCIMDAFGGYFLDQLPDLFYRHPLKHIFTIESYLREINRDEDGLKALEEEHGREYSSFEAVLEAETEVLRGVDSMDPDGYDAKLSMGDKAYREKLAAWETVPGRSSDWIQHHEQLLSWVRVKLGVKDLDRHKAEDQCVISTLRREWRELKAGRKHE